MPPRRCLLVDPSTLRMPDFSSRGYAPSRARQRHLHNCNNTEAIQILQNEWTARNQIDIRRWEVENPPQLNVIISEEQQLVDLVQNLQQDNQDEQTLSSRPEAQELSHNVPNDDIHVSLPHTEQTSSSAAAVGTQSSSQSFPPYPSMAADPQQQQQQTSLPNTSPQALNSLSNDTLQNQLESLIQQLQRQSQPVNHPPNPPFTNPLPSSYADHNSNSNSEFTSAASLSSLGQIKLGRNMHDVMHNFHLLPLPVLEELHHMRHVKLWFFTNEGLEKTRLAKERTSRYNFSRVHFDFKRQGLVAKNEYEASMKNAPEDNTLTPDQLNQAMPYFLDSIKYAHWLEDISLMFSSFDAVQRHYESRSRPIAGVYTIA